MFTVENSNKEELHEPFDELEEAIAYATTVDIGDKPQVLKVVGMFGAVHKWVPRNGWLPSGGLPPPEYGVWCTPVGHPANSGWMDKELLTKEEADEVVKSMTGANTFWTYEVKVRD